MAVKVDEQCKRCANRAIWACFWGNVFLCIFKGVIGVISGSLAVIADALHSGADVLDSVIVLIAAHLGKKPPDKTHPYGHGKTEFIAGAFIGIVLLIGASCIIVTSVGPICAGRRVNSAAIEAEAWDNRSDSMSSIPVFFGVLGAQFGFRSLDPLAALLVGILVGKVGFELLGKNLHGLMDMPLQPKEIKRIKELVVATGGVKDIGYLRTRGMGRHYLADLQILVNPKTTVEKSNAIATEVRNTLRREIKHLEDITIVCKADTGKQKVQTH